MAAGISDHFTNASNGTRPTPTTLTALRAVGASSISVGALTGWPTATAVHFVIYTTDTSGNKVAGSQLDCKGIVSGTTITNIVYKAGNDVGNSIGAIVEAAPTAAWADDVVSGMTVAHNQDGSHITDVPLTTPKVTTGIKDAAGNTILPLLGSSSATSVKLSTTAVGPTYVESGCVWSGDAYASTKAASMTAGVVYINGVRLTVAAVTARTFTASKDVYVDFTNNSDGTALITYIDTTTNAASPALTTAGATLRNAIVVVGASSIAAATNVNQGQETIVLPIASSIPYSVTDSLGNLICPRDPLNTTLGYRQNIVGFTLSASQTTPTQVTALSCPVIVPAGRKICIEIFARDIFNATATNSVQFEIWDGVVNSGTLVQSAFVAPVNSSAAASGWAKIQLTPSTSSKTYNVGIVSGGLTNVTLEAGATFPAYIRVSLA